MWMSYNGIVEHDSLKPWISTQTWNYYRQVLLRKWRRAFNHTHFQLSHILNLMAVKIIE